MNKGKALQDFSVRRNIPNNNELLALAGTYSPNICTSLIGFELHRVTCTDFLHPKGVGIVADARTILPVTK